MAAVSRSRVLGQVGTHCDTGIPNMTSTLQLAQMWDVTLHRRRGRLVITAQTTPPSGQRWRRPSLALAGAVVAPMVVDLTHLGLDEDVVSAVRECLRGSATALRVRIKVLTPAPAGRIRAIPRPGGIGYVRLDPHRGHPMTTTTAPQAHPPGFRLVPTIGPGPGPAAAPDTDHARNDVPGEIADLQRKLATMPAIEQAKGALMATYGLTDQAAFDLLRWHSQQNNIRLRDLAARLTAALPGGGIGTPVATRMDRLLDTITNDGRQPTGPAADLHRARGTWAAAAEPARPNRAQGPIEPPHFPAAVLLPPAYWVLTT